MIEIHKDTLAEISVLHAVPEGKMDNALPTVLFYHGFLSSNLVYSYIGVALAQCGFRVVMPDAPQHGDRYQGDADKRLAQFWSILTQSIDEFPHLYAGLQQRGWIEGTRFGIAGASLGGMTALGIMAHHPVASAAACLMGSGYYSTLAETLFPPLVEHAEQERMRLQEYDVIQHLDNLVRAPLLMWHGEQDEVVPANDTRRLQQALNAAGSRLRCRYEPHVTHRITPDAVATTCQFFSENLS